MSDGPAVKPAKLARSGVMREALITLRVFGGIGAGIMLMDSAPYNYTVQRDCTVCPEVNRLPTGVTTIGVDTEQSRLQLTISHELWVGRFPVMVGEYRLFATAEPAQAGNAWRIPASRRTTASGGDGKLAGSGRLCEVAVPTSWRPALPPAVGGRVRVRCARRAIQILG